MQEGKEEVTKVVYLVQNGKKSTKMHSIPLFVVEQFIRGLTHVFPKVVCIPRAAPHENVSFGIRGHRLPRSACASAQSDQVLHCPLIEILGTVEHNRVYQRSWSNYISPLTAYIYPEDTFVELK